MIYDLSAVAILHKLGYDQPTGRKWLETLKQDKKIDMPKSYMEFMELMVDCPLLGTSNLWVGKMEHKASACIPRTFYDQLQEMIDDRKDRWSKRPGKYERALYHLFQLPAEEWPQEADNYLVIGSDYVGGVGEFGIRIEDLQKDDPPVYCLKGQTLIQNKPSISEGCFSASLEKALFCGLFRILSFSIFCTDF